MSSNDFPPKNGDERKNIRNFLHDAWNKKQSAPMLEDGEETSLMFRTFGDKSKGVVVLEYNKPIMFLGMTPDQAEQLGKDLIKLARIIRGEIPDSDGNVVHPRGRKK